MTPTEIENAERAADLFERQPYRGDYALAARAIRACIEAAKEESWYKFEHLPSEIGDETGANHFQRALRER